MVLAVDDRMSVWKDGNVSKEVCAKIPDAVKQDPSQSGQLQARRQVGRVRVEREKSVDDRQFFEKSAVFDEGENAVQLAY